MWVPSGWGSPRCNCFLSRRWPRRHFVLPSRTMLLPRATRCPCKISSPSFFPTSFAGLRRQLAIGRCRHRGRLPFTLGLHHLSLAWWVLSAPDDVRCISLPSWRSLPYGSHLPVTPRSTSTISCGSCLASRAFACQAATSTCLCSPGVCLPHLACRH